MSFKKYTFEKILSLTFLLGCSWQASSQTYCTPLWTTGCTSGDDINTFMLTGANATSFNDVNTGCSAGAYDNRTAQTPVQMLQGQTYNGQMNTNFSGQGVRFWIDFNNDGTFAATEEVGTVASVGTALTPFTLAIPAAAQVGNHRMRVRCVWLATPATIDPCLSASWGEVHDYTVNILSPCAAPTGVTASGVGPTVATLSWTAPTPTVGYQYVLNTLATAPTGPGTSITGTSYPASGLTPGTTYYFHVRNLCNATTFSNWVTYSFSTPVACGATNIPTVSGITMTNANLNWPAVPGSLGYQYVLNNTSTPPTGPGTPLSTPAYNATGLTSGTLYYFHVRNLCAGGLQSLWTTVSFTTAYPPCFAPSGLTVSNININGANVSWNAVAGSLGYQWVVTTSATAPASGTATTNTNAIATGLNGSTLYYLHVRNNCGPGGFSPWVSTSFTTAATCNMPTNIMITNVGPNSAELQWDPVPGAAGFEYIIDNTPQAPAIAGVPIIYHRYVPTGLVSGTRYYAHLRTNCGGSAGYSPWVTVQFTTDTLCFAPVPVVTSVTGTSANITWQPEPNAENYQYLVSTSITPPYSGYATKATAYVANGLQKNTQYYMHLKTYCGGNDISAWRSVGFVTNDKTTSVAVNSNHDAFIEVYPNPVGNTMTFKINGFDAGHINGQLQVTDITGKVVKNVSVSAERVEVDMQGIAPGVYLVKYTDGDYANVLRIIKQ